MEKDKASVPNHGAGLPPPSGRFSGFSSSGNPMAGSSSEAGHFPHGSESNQFSHDISKMPDNPPKKIGHRRAHSEILTLPDDISFDSDLGVVGGADGPSLSDETEEDLFSMYLDMEKFNSSSATSVFQMGESSAAGGAAPAPGGSGGAGNTSRENVAVGSAERPRYRHQHSQSMDGSMNIKSEMLMSGSEEASSADAKKAMSAAKLAELALIDPKRAKRIWANRQSAARSKERKMRYIAELERKVQTLQTEATSLSAQLTLLQRDTTGLSAENSELKLHLQTVEQQVHLQDALNDALKEEIMHMKLLTNQPLPNGGPMMNFSSFGANRQFYPNSQAMHTLLTAQQFQQLQIHSQKQQQQHQFQQHHHLNQLQQPQLQQQPPQQQLQEQQQQHTGESRMRGSMPSPNQNDNSSDIKPSMTKD